MPHIASGPQPHSRAGSMNKVAVAVAGVVLFHEAASWRNLASIALGLAAGVVFVLAKATEARK